jgi:hypothetical protein
VSDVPGTWTHTAGTDGGPQSHYEVKVYTDAQYGAGAFSADTSAATWTSGIVASSEATATAIGLTGGTYRWYTRTAQTVNGTPHWSAWAYEAFTVSLSTSEVETVTPTADVANGLMSIVTNIETASDTAAIINLERSEAENLLADIPLGTTDAGSGNGPLAVGWNTATVATPTSFTTSVGTSGTAGSRAYQKIAATLDSGDAVYFRPASASPHVAGDRLYPVEEGDVVSFAVDLRTTTIVGAGLKFHIWVTWDGISDNEKELTIPASSILWRRYEHSAVAPADCNARVNITMQATSGSGHVASLDIAEPRMTVNEEWVPVRFADEYAVASDTITSLDYEAPTGVPLRYRARAVKSDGTIGRWVEQTATADADWDADGVWIKDPYRALNNLKLDWTEFPDPTEDITQGVFYPLSSDDDDTSYAVVLSQARQSRTGEWMFETETYDDVAPFKLLMRKRVVYVQCPESYQFPGGYFAPGAIQEITPEPSEIPQWRYWKVAFVEVDRP